MLDLLKGEFSLSVSGVFIMGNEKFKDPKDYEGEFTSVYGSIGRLKGGIAYSDSCYAIAVGGKIVGSKKPSIGFSKTNYTMITSFHITF